MLLYNNGEIDLSSVSDHLNITKRMVTYYLKQLNDIFSSNNLPEIILSNNKLSISYDNANDFIKTLSDRISAKDYFLNAYERQEIIILLIGLSKDNATIEKLVNYFDVSKNTIVNDLSLIRKLLAEHHIKLLNNDKDGYYFVGDESIIRYVLMICYHHCDNFLIGNYKQKLIIHCLPDEIDKENIIESFSKVLLDSEKYSDENFSYLVIDELVQTMLLVYDRSKKATIKMDIKILENNLSISSYIYAELQKLGFELNRDEFTYMYLILQSAKVSSLTPFDYQDEVTDVMNDIIDEFKRISQLNLFGNEQIYSMFLTHIKSMYYRTKYRIKIMDYQEQSVDDVLGFYYIAQKVFEKVGKKYNLLYDDDEVRLLSYYFACLENDNEINEDKDNLIIVQTGSLGDSLFLRNQLNLFFDSKFNLKIVAFDELKEKIDCQTRLIITTDEYVYPCIKTVTVHQILTKNDKQKLLDWYLNNNELSEEQVVIRDIMNIVKNYAVIQDKQKLYQYLNSYFTTGVEQKKLKLSGIFVSEHISIVNEVSNWQEFIYIAGQSILDDKLIKKSYLDDVVTIIEEHGPYCECVDGILIAHAEPKDNVKRPVLSLAVTRKPLYVPEWDKKISAIFILGVIDNESHANAFSELMKNLVKDDLYKKMHNFKDREEIYRKLVY